VEGVVEQRAAESHGSAVRAGNVVMRGESPETSLVTVQAGGDSELDPSQASKRRSQKVKGLSAHDFSYRSDRNSVLF
jgi:hypothetical protein